ncbi:anion permease, partial [bacterium]|nr:anion permease [bacterium]
MTHKAKQESPSSVYNLLIITIGACILWLTPPPVGVEQIGWQSFIIFLVTLALIISKSYDMGVVSFIALSLSLVTGTLTIDVCLEKFSYPVSWLVLMAFFIARGFVVSGLGSRIALYMAACLGSTPLRLSYALIFAEVFIAPFIPSNTARGGGLIYPIAHSLGDNIFGKPVGIHKNQRHLTAFLLYGCFQANLISSSMFLTAMAGNPMIASIGATFGLDGDWVSWCKAAFLPGIICLLIT